MRSFFILSIDNGWKNFYIANMSEKCFHKENIMPFPINVMEYLKQKRQSVATQSSYSQSFPMRGYVGSTNRISGKEADKQIMEMINAW